MKIGRNKLLSIVVATLACLVILRLYGLSTRSTNGDFRLMRRDVAGLSIAGRYLELGDLWEAKRTVRELPIENRSTRTIWISEFQTSCGCLSVEPKSLSLSPGETKWVSVQFDTARRLPADYGKPLRPFTEMIQPIIDGSRVSGGGKPYWTFNAQIRSRVTFDVPNLNFGSVLVFGQSQDTRKVIATAHVPLARLEAQIRPEIATVRVSQINKSQAEIVVAPWTDRRIGRFEGQLTLQAIHGEAEPIEVGWLRVEGEVLPEVRPIPAILTLQATKVGDIGEGVILLQGARHSEQKVAAISCDTTNLEIHSADFDGVARGQAFVVRLKIDRVGDFTTRAHFTIRSGANEPKVYDMEVRCRGIGD